MQSGLDFEDVLFPPENNGLDNEQYCTKFQIGFVINPKEHQMIQITEYTVYLRPQKRFRNTDLIDIFGKKLKDVRSKTKIEPY